MRPPRSHDDGGTREVCSSLAPTVCPRGGRSLVALAVCLLVLGGCGEQRSASKDQYRGCTGQPVGKARLGDQQVTLRYVRPGADSCPDSLVARSRRGLHGVDVSRLDASTIRVVRLRGVDRDLVAVDGPVELGTRTHLYGAGLRELTSGGEPLLPVNPTGRRSPVDATCASGGRIEVTTARTHVPPGIVLAWDVTRTTYDVGDGTAEQVRSTVRRAAADPTLRASRPELYDGRLLTGCG